jgi:threonine/homoserine/homoserine lactone efflux protein
MGPVIGDLIPLAVGVAISPAAIMAVILMLLAERAGRASAGFLVGTVLGIAVAVVVFVLLSGLFNLGTSSQPSTISSWIKLIVGLGLLLLGIREWDHRPRPGQSPKLPKWLAAVDHMTPARAAGLGFGLGAVNPKNLALTIAAGVAIANGNLSFGGDVVAVVVFTVIGASTVGLPVIAYAVAGARMRRPLDQLKTWLAENNTTVTSVLLVIIGAVLIGKGFGGLL